MTRSYKPTHQGCSAAKPFKPQNGVTVIQCLPTATSEAQQGIADLQHKVCIVL